MPNWVFNNLTVTGKQSDLDDFIVQARQPYMEFHKRLTVNDEGETVFAREPNRVEEPLSFWNFVRPEDEILNDYYGDEDSGMPLSEKLQHKTNHWYDWNIRNWGCKWDASDVEVFDRDNGVVDYSFSTPWSIPEPVFHAMVKQFPTLQFTLVSCEEQGWGAELAGVDGEVSLVKEWDIPCSHAENMEHRGWCYCEENDDTEYMYDDCPKVVANVTH